MEKRWEKPFKDREEARKALGPMGLSFHICWFLGCLFAVLGLIAAAADITLGLGTTAWLLLAIAAFLAGMPMLITWALAMRLLGIEAETKKKE